MERAVVAIGVNQTGGLPTLQAAAAGARAFAAWAASQQIPPDRITVLTDETGKVTRDAILDAVAAITDLGFVEQLVVYFSGHGINNGLGEQWLLSDAPRNSGAAVNVVGSEYAARFCGIGHVVFISDACRTAAPDIQTQRVTGGDIFPNQQPEGEERPVDQFFATLVGRPALEVRLAEGEAERHVAAYTAVLLEALAGKVPDIVVAGDGRRVIRPAALKRHLALAVPDFLRKSIVGGTATQQPDARLTSGDIDAWLAEFPDDAVAGPPVTAATTPAGTVGGRIRARRRRAPGASRGGAALPPPFGESAATATARGLVSVSREHLLAALLPEAAGAKRQARARTPEPALAGAARSLFAQSLASASQRETAEAAPGHFAITIRGARITEAVAHQSAAAAAVETGSRRVSVSLAGKRTAATVALRLDDRSVLVLPALRGFAAALTVDPDGRLDDVAYEATAERAAVSGTPGVPEAASRQLRDVIAASSALGVFRVDQAREAEALADRLRQLRTLDPALAVHAAYAFHDRRLRDAVAGLATRVERESGVQLFDLALLSRALSGASRARPAGPRARLPLCPFVPMRTVGWALLGAFGVSLPGPVAALRGYLRPSVWTHFDAPAARTIVKLITEGAVD